MWQRVTRPAHWSAVVVLHHAVFPFLFTGRRQDAHGTVPLCSIVYQSHQRIIRVRPAAIWTWHAPAARNSIYGRSTWSGYRLWQRRRRSARQSTVHRQYITAIRGRINESRPQRRQPRRDARDTEVLQYRGLQVTVCLINSFGPWAKNNVIFN